MFRHPLAPLRSLAGVLAAGCGSTPDLPPGAQAPGAPHPGSIVVRYVWNGSAQTRRAQDFLDRFAFRRVDAHGEPAEHARAAWCVPVVEIDVLSVDASGRLAAPADAAQIESTRYGPGHRFLDHTTAVRTGRPPA